MSKADYEKQAALVVRVLPEIEKEPERFFSHKDIMGTILFKPDQTFGEGLFFDN